MEELLLVNDLHLACRHLMKAEDELVKITKSGDMTFITDEVEVMAKAARYLLKDRLTEEKLNSNTFSDWFHQEDTSIYQCLEILDNEETEE